MEKACKFIRTSEAWYPTFKDGTIRVVFTELPTAKNSYRFRVAVWGADDFGLERDFDSRPVARRIYEKIGDYTTQKQLQAWGFVRA